MQNSDRLRDHLPAGLTMSRFVVTAYGPTLLVSFGYGAVIPMLVIQARALGASAALAALLSALVGVGMVLGDLPAGWLAAKLGDRKALIGACIVDALVIGSATFVHQLWLFAVIVFVHGLTGSVFGLARQSYLTVVVPLRWRSRAMSSLGGVFRIGGFLGPLAGALVTTHFGLIGVFPLASAMGFAAAIATLLMPDVDNQSATTESGESLSLWSVLRAHRHTLLAIGWGMLAVALVRTARQVIIPLWCDGAGVSVATTNLIYAVSMGAEVLLFFPAGLLMDRLGRWWAAVPTMIIMAIGFAGLPLTHSAMAIAGLSFVIGVGNGLSSGIILTLGADASPVVGRSQFLAGCRIFTDVGTSTGPLLISLATAVVALWAAPVALALVGVWGAVQLARHLPMSGQLPMSEPR